MGIDSGVQSTLANVIRNLGLCVEGLTPQPYSPMGLLPRGSEKPLKLVPKETSYGAQRTWCWGQSLSPRRPTLGHVLCGWGVNPSTF